MSPRPAHQVAAAIIRRRDEVVLVLSADLASRARRRVPGEARFFSVEDAVERLRRTTWLAIAADYLEGKIEKGSLHFERWLEDGRVHRLA